MGTRLKEPRTLFFFAIYFRAEKRIGSSLHGHQKNTSEGPIGEGEPASLNGTSRKM